MSVRPEAEDLQGNYLTKITSVLTQAFKNRRCRIYLFGSRATGNYTKASDFDIAVLSSENIAKEISISREMMELSNIPFTVDLVDLRTASEEFVHQVEQGVLLWSN